MEIIDRKKIGIQTYIHQNQNFSHIRVMYHNTAAISSINSRRDIKSDKQNKTENNMREFCIKEKLWVWAAHVPDS